MKIRHLLLVAIMALTTMATAVAQAPLSFTYQAVVRNSSGRLVSNATVGVKISIVRDSATGRAVYSDVQTPRTNANGLFTIVIGNSQNGIDTITWRNGPYFLKSEVDPNGGTNYTLTSVQQMLSVPYALHAHTVDSIIGGVNFIERQVLSMNGDTVFLTGGSYVVLPPSFSGDYNDLTNKPTIPTNVSAFYNDAGYLTSATLTETQVLSIRHDTVFLTGGSFVKLPAGFSGNYNDLTNKPTIPTVPTNVSAFTNDAGYLTSYTETQVLSKRGDTVFLTGGSFVVLPSETQNLSDVATNNDSVNSQIKNLYDPTDSMDAVNLRTLNAVISRYDSIINHLLNIIDTLQNPVVPTVVTVSISNVTATTATANGCVTSNGGDMVTARGVCWSTSHNPTISDSHTTNGTGAGNYSSSITGLAGGTTYYVRAYATNSAGTAYGNELSFNSTADLPTVNTTAASNITATAATSGGNVTNDGGATVSARGVCWSTSHNPTTSDNHTTNGIGTGNFTSSITGLTASTTYYVRAYATNSVGTAYGNETTITTLSNIPEGALTGVFSIGRNKKVRFSKGNLQWSATGGGSTATTHSVAGGGTASGTWRFATNQWDTIGVRNNYASSSYSGWIDLFTWGTSGFNNKHPYFVGSGYSSDNDYPITMTNTNYDWGVYNAIYNGGNQPGLWRTLTKTEWDTLLFRRTTTSGKRFAHAVVYGRAGLIIVPDNWNDSIFVLNNTNTRDASCRSNSISYSQWVILENAGCVFLPQAGHKTSNSGFYRPYSSYPGYIGGCYWTSTANHSSSYVQAFSCVFGYAIVDGSGSLSLNNTTCIESHSVRLVQDVIGN